MIWVVLLIILLLFQFAVFFGPPYLPTRRKQREQALDLLDLKPGQTLIDLGSGDGAMLIAAAQRGLKVVGYEINPILVAITWLRTRRYGQNVRIILGNFWKKDWPDADGVFVFLRESYMEPLDQKMTKEFKRPVKLVSYVFEIKDKKPIKTKGGLFLYRY